MNKQQFKIIIPVESDLEVGYTIDVLKHACEHMIEVYQKDINRHKDYAYTHSKEYEENKEAIHNHINGDIHAIGRYQRIIETLEKNTSVVIHN